MFTERFNKILTAIGASSSDIATMMGCDRSNISRFAKGQRIPRAAGKSAYALIDGIFGYSDSNGKIAELCGEIGCNDETAEEIKSALYSWLFEDEIKEKESLPVVSAANHREFGKKLSKLMDISGLSNSHLSHLISIDASYISRFKNGSRVPRTNEKIKDGICNACLNSIVAKGNLSELSEIIEIPIGALSGHDSAYNEIYRWLFGNDKEEKFALGNLVESIESFPAALNPQPAKAESMWQGEIELSSVYYGKEGLQRAVMRFLSFVTEKHPQNVFLYSDQNMDWMTSNPSFTLSWSSLMASCIKGGTRINVIHNIYRDIGEMSDAIKNWLPLYPSGMIKSYYCKRKPDSRFSTTLFLCPGEACISGNNVIGTEDLHGIYRYDTDETVLRAELQMYNDLLAESRTLVRAFKTLEPDNLPLNPGPEVTVISSALSLATMPDDLLLSMLDRCRATDNIRNFLTSLHEKQKTFYRRMSGEEGIHECVPALKFTNEENAPRADLPGLEVRYTKEEYAKHLENIAKISEENSGYRFYPLREPVFDNIRLRVSRSETVVTRCSAPYITFVFEHPAMCEAFVAHSREIRNENYIDKVSLKNYLYDLIK